MLKNYFKIAWRNLQRSKGYSAINITGLAIGMAVAILIGLWVWDEVSFNKSFENYNRLGKLYQNRTFNGQTATYGIMAHPVSKELRTNYPDFKEVALTTENNEHILAYGEKKISSRGMFTEPQFTKMFSLKMKTGVQNGLNNMNSILISETLSENLFGTDDPVGKVLSVDNKGNLAVTGVFEDFCKNTEFAEVTLLMPWAYLHSIDESVRQSANDWGSNNYPFYVQLADNADENAVQKKIKNLINDKVTAEERISKPELLLHPMKKWRLYSEFAEGKNTGGFIVLVRLFAIAGLFVLLLACINFMNLSTARSEKRAKEVGVRKTIGSGRSQLINQFLSESFLISLIAFILSIGLVSVSLPWFNNLLQKEINIFWSSPAFWLICFGFVLVTGLLAGSYPAFYLSSFEPIKVLKGTFKAGRLAALPRKALVVVQFTVSVALIIGTVIVFRQIQHAKDRPVGYNNSGLVYVPINTPELNNLNYNVLRNELLATNVVDNMSESSHLMTEEGSLTTGFTWKGSAAGSDLLVSLVKITEEHGKTVGFDFVTGRDFSRNYQLDSAGVVINETFAKIIGGKNVIGTVLNGFNNSRYTVIGVVKNMVTSSPYSKAAPAMFVLRHEFHNVVNIKVKSTVSISSALSKIETVFKKYNPAAPFQYRFADELFAKKFDNEKLIGKLALFFAALAIFISCLGIFGLASFIAEQRTKEIGVRKVLGASVINVWKLLSKDFVLLVFISFVIAAPLAWYFMNNWLQNYEYRTTISWWIFAATCLSALLITILTVSFQAIKAAVINPVKSLRTE